MTDLHRSRIIAWSFSVIGLCGVLVLLAANRDCDAVAALPCALFFGGVMVALSLAFDTTAPLVWIVLGFGLAEFARLRRFTAGHAY